VYESCGAAMSESVFNGRVRAKYNKNKVPDFGELPLPNEQTGRAIKPRLFTLLTGPDMMLFASILLTELGQIVQDSGEGEVVRYHKDRR